MLEMSMTSVLTWYAGRSRALLDVMAVLTILLYGTPAHAGSAPAPTLHFESTATGDVVLNARGATIAEVLRSIGAMEGFEVVIDERVPRRLVNLNVSQVPVEHVLRQILRGRNHALVYAGDPVSLKQVIVLAPSAPRKPRAASSRRPSRARGSGTAARR
jgi:hypothetical protein